MNTKQKKRNATKVERKVAADLGGRRVYASGSGTEKGDVRVAPAKTMTPEGVVDLDDTPYLRIESKTAPSGKYVFTAKDWQKLVQALHGETPVFHIQINHGSIRLDLVVTRRTDFEHLTGTTATGRITKCRSYTLRLPSWNDSIQAFLDSGPPHGQPPHVRLDVSRTPNDRWGDVCLWVYRDFLRTIKEQR